MAPNTTNKRLPEFFKVYIPIYSSSSLKIPDDWVQHLNALPRNVVLQNRMGNVWRIKMRHTDNGVFLLNGWQKFVEGNSLEFGDILIFQHIGDGRFEVKILGKSCCEKSETGPLVGIEIKEQEQEDDHETVDVGIDLDDDHTSDSDDSEDNVEEEEEIEEEASEVIASLHKRGKRICGNDGDRSKKSAGVRARVPRESISVLTSKEVKQYVNDQNPYFVTKLSETRKNLLFVPSYVLKDFGIQLAEQVTFLDELERKWPGTVMYWKDGRIWIKGWRQVCRWNDVQKDDHCICEFPLATGRSNIILVHIVRGVGSQSQPANQEPSQAGQ
ncbi:B3 domain-containing protein REM20-like isoform X2 [Mangifera indica]|uniref:B3 domain-containing protein REM20-like isoform X2 n=1 Tax=Mangifera indica TaxID=29780 RepID=UPI001CFAB65F|nr:B3 domain-containing protein REM20-like isoform X2 [Mangifera indica]